MMLLNAERHVQATCKARLQRARPVCNVQGPSATCADEAGQEEPSGNPSAKSGVFIDHRDQGGPLLHVPEEDLKRVDWIGREMRAEEDHDEKIDFDWLEDETICVPEQQGIAVYTLKNGSIIIRQKRAWCDDEDSFIEVRPENLQSLIDRLCDLAGIGSAGRDSTCVAER